MTKINLCNEVLENAIGVHRSFEEIEPLEIMDAVAVQAMEELLEYRAIGTVEELQKMKGVITDFPIDCGSPISNVEEIWNQLKKYLAIGTIEEFKALKEKNVAKKPIYSDFDNNGYDEIIPYKAICPICGNEFEFGSWNEEENYHCICGQKLDWQ